MKPLVYVNTYTILDDFLTHTVQMKPAMYA